MRFSTPHQWHGAAATSKRKRWSAISARDQAKLTRRSPRVTILEFLPNWPRSGGVFFYFVSVCFDLSYDRIPAIPSMPNRSGIITLMSACGITMPNPAQIGLTI